MPPAVQGDAFSYWGRERLDRIVSSIKHGQVYSLFEFFSRFIFSFLFFFPFQIFNFTDQLIRARCSISAPPMKFLFRLERVHTRMSFQFVLFLYLMIDEKFFLE